MINLFQWQGAEGEAGLLLGVGEERLGKIKAKWGQALEAEAADNPKTRCQNSIFLYIVI